MLHVLRPDVHLWPGTRRRYSAKPSQTWFLILGSFETWHWRPPQCFPMCSVAFSRTQRLLGPVDSAVPALAGQQMPGWLEVEEAHRSSPAGGFTQSGISSARSLFFSHVSLFLNDISTKKTAKSLALLTSSQATNCTQDVNSRSTTEEWRRGQHLRRHHLLNGPLDGVCYINTAAY